MHPLTLDFDTKVILRRPLELSAISAAASVRIRYSFPLQLDLSESHRAKDLQSAASGHVEARCSEPLLQQSLQKARQDAQERVSLDPVILTGAESCKLFSDLTDCSILASCLQTMAS